MSFDNEEIYCEISKAASLAKHWYSKLKDPTVSQKYLLTLYAERLYNINEARKNLVKRVVIVWNRAESPAIALHNTQKCEKIITECKLPIVDKYLAQKQRYQTSQQLFYPEVLVGFRQLRLRAQQQHNFCTNLSSMLLSCQEQHRVNKIEFEKKAIEKLNELEKAQTITCRRLVNLVFLIQHLAGILHGTKLPAADHELLQSQFRSMLAILEGPSGLKSTLHTLKKKSEEIQCIKNGIDLNNDNEFSNLCKKILEQRVQIENIQKEYKNLVSI